MAIRDLHLLGHPVLRQRAQEVPEVTDEIRAFIDDLFETMGVASGVGLAANQVGSTWRVAVINAESRTFAMINPRIVSSEGEATEEEGCLSIPDLFAEVTRPERIVLEALNEAGEPFRLEAGGLVARAVQHEIDHLDGVLFIDRIGALKRQVLLSRYKRDHKGEALTKTPRFEESKAKD
jgi:peptide deformylase